MASSSLRSGDGGGGAAGWTALDGAWGDDVEIFGADEADEAEGAVDGEREGMGAGDGPQASHKKGIALSMHRGWFIESAYRKSAAGRA